jgi:hypothetical protein
MEKISVDPPGSMILFAFTHYLKNPEANPLPIAAVLFTNLIREHLIQRCEENLAKASP